MRKTSKKTREPAPVLNPAILMEVYDLLEAGNAKEAYKTIDELFLTLATENPVEFLRLLRDAAYDRPSAWWFYTGIVKPGRFLENLELAMHAGGEPRAVKERIRNHFADLRLPKSRSQAAFRLLFSPYWDT